MTDQEIILQLKEGHESCLVHLYAHLDKVKGWVLQNNGSEDDALDLFQEAIIVFYKKVMANEYTYKSKISTYLFGIARNQWLNQLNRRKKYERRVSPVGRQDRMEAPEVDLLENGDTPSLENYLKTALEKLGEPCKSLLEATVFLNIKMDEIAQRFHYSGARSASQQKLRCLKRLKNSLSYDVIMRLR